MRTERLFRHAVRQRLDNAIHLARARAASRRGVLEAYDRLLHHVRSRSTILRATGPRDDRMLLNAGVVALAVNHEAWLRAVETWIPPTAAARLQFASLARHLLAAYPVPTFLDFVWFEPPVAEVLAQHGWFIHIATGGSVRAAGFPLELTRAAAHWLPQVPHHLSVPAALRWAQVRGAGGSEDLAGVVAAGRLGTDLTDSDFWESVIRFLARYPDLDLARVEPLVEYVRLQRTVDHRFSMKGRTLAALLRDVAATGEAERRAPRRPPVSWARSPLHEFRLTDPRERVWTITELLSSQELIQEGKAMRHCVATYTPRCLRRRTSIWSLAVENRDGRFRVATIEVDLVKRAIIQARGKCDRPTRGVALEVVQRWAAEEGLRMAGVCRCSTCAGSAASEGRADEAQDGRSTG